MDYCRLFFWKFSNEKWWWKSRKSSQRLLPNISWAAPGERQQTDSSAGAATPSCERQPMSFPSVRLQLIRRDKLRSTSLRKARTPPPGMISVPLFLQPIQPRLNSCFVERKTFRKLITFIEEVHCVDRYSRSRRSHAGINLCAAPLVASHFLIRRRPIKCPAHLCGPASGPGVIIGFGPFTV